MVKLLSLFKFKRKQIDISLLLKDLFENVKSKFLTEFNNESYNWIKSKNIKEYECIILSKFFIDYSFSILSPNLDKKLIASFNKISEESFIDFYENKYSNRLPYKEFKHIVDEKYNSYFSLRKEHKAPLCWNMIYASVTSKPTPDEIEIEIAGLKKAIKLLKNNSQLTDVSYGFNDRIDKRFKEIETFDLSEILFRRNIRYIKKQLSSANIIKHLTSKK